MFDASYVQDPNKRKTKTVTQSLNPVWNDVLILPLRPVFPSTLFQQYLYFELLDDATKESLGQSVVSLDALQSVFQAHCAKEMEGRGGRDTDGGDSLENTTKQQQQLRTPRAGKGGVVSFADDSPLSLPPSLAKRGASGGGQNSSNGNIVTSASTRPTLITREFSLGVDVSANVRRNAGYEGKLELTLMMAAKPVPLEDMLTQNEEE